MVLVLLTGFFLNPASAQSLEVPVKLEVDHGNIDGITLKITKNGKESGAQSTSRNMKLKLEFNQNYILSFSKKGYVTKTIEFNTKVTPERIEQGFEPYKIGIKLFEQLDENQVVYNQPVGKIRFDATLDDFNFETDYSKSILSAFNDPAEKKKPTEATAKTESNNSEPVAEEKKSSSSPQQVSGTKESTVSENISANAPEEKSASEKNASAENINGEPSSPKQPVASVGNNSPAGNSSAGNADFPTHATYSSGASAPEETADIKTDEKISREDIVEKNRVIIKVKVSSPKKDTFYTIVQYKWGGCYFFRENRSISENLFTLWTGVRP